MCRIDNLEVDRYLSLHMFFCAVSFLSSKNFRRKKSVLDLIFLVAFSFIFQYWYLGCRAVSNRLKAQSEIFPHPTSDIKRINDCFCFWFVLFESCFGFDTNFQNGYILYLFIWRQGASYDTYVGVRRQLKGLVIFFMIWFPGLQLILSGSMEKKWEPSCETKDSKFFGWDLSGNCWPDF